MPAIRFLCLGLLVSCLIAGLARSQTYRFDLGPSGSPIAPGYLPIHPGSLYDPVAGYGWTTPPQIAISRQGVSAQFAMDEHNFPAPLIEDSTSSGAAGGGGAALPFRFRIDAAPGLLRRETIGCCDHTSTAHPPGLSAPDPIGCAQNGMWWPAIFCVACTPQALEVIICAVVALPFVVAVVFESSLVVLPALRAFCPWQNLNILL